jgi:hypothetical protein
MPDQDDRDDLVAPAKGGGKQPSALLPKLNICGDIGLKIGRDGTWFYQGSPIGRKPLVKLFASVLRREDDGRYYLVTPVEKVSIEVEDLPYVAVEMRREGAGEAQRLTFVSNVDETAMGGPEHAIGFEPRANGAFTPFVVMRGGLKARLARPIYYELAALAVEGPGQKGPGVWSGGVFFAFPGGEPAAARRSL